MPKAFAIGEELMDQHLEIFVQMEWEIFSSYLSSTSLPSHYEPEKLNKFLLAPIAVHCFT